MVNRYIEVLESDEPKLLWAPVYAEIVLKKPPGIISRSLEAETIPHFYAMGLA
jgi:hypothetical protein